ncbi:MAG: efflux RND transporter periplasmic adaptor subunit [Halieaceae bacterium]|nr:efflux RND transporter periplasmic adaptor subunit [Halieaceae bacterium]
MVACSAKEEATGPPPTRPVKIFVVEGSTGTTVRNFPGRVDASQRADLAFRVSGQVQEILVKEGDAVALNQTLARLDPTDFKITLDDRQATYDNARRNFERGKELVVKGNISRQDYDRMEAQYRTSLAALSQAKQNMEYTELQAPFAGRVAQRMVEKFEDVLGKQTVFSLQNVDALDISINLPESLVRSLRVSTAPPEELNKTRGAQVVANAVFEGRDTRFVLSVKEIATAADPQTQTFRTTFTMPAPTDFVVLPGMTATVVVDFSRMMEPQVVTWVPVRAVQADSGLTPRVWILNPSTLTVSSREVEIGRMAKGEIEILSGLEGGEEVVAIGAPYLAEGLKVTRMIQTEQAVPRAGDPE